MTTQRNTSTEKYTIGEILEGASGALSAVAVGAAMMPGFLLTVPGLIILLAPVIAIGVLAALVAVIVAIAALPIYVGRLLARRAAHAVSDFRIAHAMTPAPSAR